MNSERKIDSSETIVDKSWNGNGSQANLLLGPLLSQSQSENQTAWKTMNHIFPACEAITSPMRADRDLCANALCSSSEIALMLRVVVEAVCILQCYAGIAGQANRHPATVIIGIAVSPLFPPLSRA